MEFIWRWHFEVIDARVGNKEAHPTFVGMDRFDAPRADVAVLSFLLFIVAFIGLVAWLAYRLMLPTIVPNPGLAAYKPPAGAAILLPTAASFPVPEMERRARDAAAEENTKQGLEPHLALAAAEPGTMVPRESQPKETQTRPKAQKRQQFAPDPWRTWGFAERSYGGRFWLR